MEITVLIADDSEIVLKAMCRILNETPDMLVVGQASSFDELLELLARTEPDVLVLDLGMPERDGFTVEHVKSALEGVCILTVSVSTEPESEALSLGYGAHMLLDKMDLFATLASSIVECKKRANAQAAGTS